MSRWAHLEVAGDADTGEVASIEFRLRRPHELTVDLDGFTGHGGGAFACAVWNPAGGSAYPGVGYAKSDAPPRDGRDVRCTWGGKSLKSLGAAAIQLRARPQARRGKLYGWNLV